MFNNERKDSLPAINGNHNIDNINNHQHHHHHHHNNGNSNNNNGNGTVGGPIPPSSAAPAVPATDPDMQSQQRVAPGLRALHELFKKIYPDQLNPLTVTAIVKYWLGGPDPLDYISMYENPGDPDQGIPPHWHYISCGLTDLHGDGRVHPISETSPLSGCGFELTFRLARKSGDEPTPPTWPANIMQKLARYVFNSSNQLVPGDHVSWHEPLDCGNGRITQILMTRDPQLPSARTDFGDVSFVQILGVTSEELSAAQRWNGEGVLNLLRSPSACSPWLVTDMTRAQSIMDMDPTVAEKIQSGFEREGSNLSGVSALCSWTEASYDQNAESEEKSAIKTEPCDEEQKKLAEVQGRSLRGLHVTFNVEAGKLLPLAIKGRVLHGRHFTFKSIVSHTAITFVASTVTGTAVSSERPFVVQGPWLQVYLPDELAAKMAQDFEIINTPQRLRFPASFCYPENKLAITIVNE